MEVILFTSLLCSEANIGSIDQIKKIDSVTEKKCLNLSAALPVITFLK